MPNNLSSQGWNGFSLLVDDVERYMGSALNFSLAGLEAGLPHFFRLAVSAYTFGAGLLTFMGYSAVHEQRKSRRFHHARDPVA